MQFTQEARLRRSLRLCTQSLFEVCAGYTEFRKFPEDASISAWLGDD